MRYFKILILGLVMCSSASVFAAVTVCNETGKDLTATPIDFERNHYTKVIKAHGEPGRITWSTLGSHLISYTDVKGNGCVINVRAGQQKHVIFVEKVNKAHCKHLGDIVTISK